MTSRIYSAAPFQGALVRLFSAAALSAVMIFATTVPSSAQVLKRAVQGGLLGAGIGAIAGGGRGAGKGAAIGAAVGAVAGAAERSNDEDDYDRRHRRHYGHEPRQQYSYAPPPPPPGYDDSLVYNIQTSLGRLGYDPGPPDGVYGDRTAEAIRAYEYNNQLPLTGQPSPNVYNHMLSHGG